MTDRLAAVRSFLSVIRLFRQEKRVRPDENHPEQHRTKQVHNKALCVMYVLALFTVGLVIGYEKAHAHFGRIHAGPQTNVAGNVFEAVVLWVSFPEVGAATPAGALGAGLVLAADVSSQQRAMVKTVDALLGGLIGERTANATMKPAVQETIVRFVLPGGAWRSLVIVQPAPTDQVFAQERVYVYQVRGHQQGLEEHHVTASGPGEGRNGRSWSSFFAGWLLPGATWLRGCDLSTCCAARRGVRGQRRRARV